MSKGQAEKSHESHNERFTLSTANFATVGFSPSIDTNTASSGKFLFTSANLLFFFKTLNSLRKNSQRIPFSCLKTPKIVAKFMTVASGEIKLQSERSHLSRSETESCKVSAFHS